MKVNRSKTLFKELLEEYISNPEKDYYSNQTGDNNHPIFTLIQNTLQKIEVKYYYRKLSYTLTYFFVCLIYLEITIVFPSLPMVYFIIFPLINRLFFYIIGTKFIKTPDLVDITCLSGKASARPAFAVEYFLSAVHLFCRWYHNYIQFRIRHVRI